MRAAGAPTARPRASARRNLLKGGLALGAGAVSAGLSSSAGASIERAMALDAASTNPTLSDIRHVVILMQENRSFDHYFGTLSGVQGLFGPARQTQRDRRLLPSGLAAVRLPARRRRRPHRVPGALPPRAALPDRGRRHHQRHQPRVGHPAPELEQREDGHLRAGAPGRRRRQELRHHHGLLHRSDLAFYYALADAFTICDAYHCSVLGPTDPNRVMALSGTIDPAGDGRRARRSSPRRRTGRSSTASSTGRPCPSSCSMRA